MPEPTISYAPWQLQEVRRQLRAYFPDDPEEGLSRAAKMSGLPMRTVRVLCERDEKCKAIVKGSKAKPEEPQQEVQPVPKPPEGHA